MIDFLVLFSRFIKKSLLTIFLFFKKVLLRDAVHLRRFATYCIDKLRKGSLKFFLLLFLLLNLFEALFVSFVKYQSIQSANITQYRFYDYERGFYTRDGFCNFLPPKIKYVSKDQKFDPNFDWSKSFDSLPLDYQLEYGRSFGLAENEEHFGLIKSKIDSQWLNYCDYLRVLKSGGVTSFFAMFLASFLSPEIASPNITAIFNYRALIGGFGYYFLIIFFGILYVILDCFLISCFHKNRLSRGEKKMNSREFFVKILIIISWYFSIWSVIF